MLNGERERIDRIENANGTTTVRTISEVFSQGLLVLKTAEERTIPGVLSSAAMARTAMPPLLTASEPTTPVTEPAALKSEQLVTQSTATTTTTTTDVAASTNTSSTSTVMKTMFKLIILIALVVLLYLAWKKWGKTLMDKIKAHMKKRVAQPSDGETD